MARAIWKGTLGFGLVSIGVELLSAEKSEEIDLDLLDRRDNARIGYMKYNKSTQQPVPAEEIVRGFAIAEDEYVILSAEDLKAANPKATQSIDIFGFVPSESVPRVFYAKPYYVSPVKGSDRAYALLRDVLRKSEQLALATVVIHTRQHVAAVYPHEDALVVQLLRYSADLKSPDDAGVRTVPALAGGTSSKEVAMAQQLLTSMEEQWSPDDYHDTYREDLMRLITQRAKRGGKSSPASQVATSQPTKVLDLVAALQRSLSAGDGARAGRGSTSSPTRAPAKTASPRKAPARAAKRPAAKKKRGRVA